MIAAPLDWIGTVLPRGDGKIGFCLMTAVFVR